MHEDQGGTLVAVFGDEAEGTLGRVAVDDAVCGVEGSRISDRQRTRGLRTGAYVEEFGSAGVSGVSGIDSSAVVSGAGSSVSGDAGIGASVDVEGPSC